MNGPEWDEAAFREQVAANLRDGRFTLIIVVDRVNEDLSRIIRYVNQAGRPAFTSARWKSNATSIIRPKS